MSVHHIETPKSKHAQLRRWGCLRFLLIPIVLAVACYGGLWLFARYGGEWVMSDLVPLPPRTELVAMSYNNLSYATEGHYIQKYHLYLSSMTHQELYKWYNEQGMIFSDCLTEGILATTERCGSDRGSNSLEESPFGTFKSDLYRASIWLTSSVNERWGATWNISLGFVGVEIFDTYATEYWPFDGIDVPNGKTVFIISTAWPRDPETPFWIHKPVTR